MPLSLRSSAFDNNSRLPDTYTCEGQDRSPPLAIDGIPARTKTLALIMDDPDAARGTWDHWITFNLPPDTRELPENASLGGFMPGGSVQALNSWGKSQYGGACPPRAHGDHRYIFRVYALDTSLSLDKTVHKHDVLAAMNGHILESAELVGLYSRT